MEEEARWSAAGRLRAERSLARSRVARGLLRGREGPYRYRSCRFRAASPSQPELTELSRAAARGAERGARVSVSGRPRTTAERAAREPETRARARIQHESERKGEGDRDQTQDSDGKRKKKIEREGGRDRDEEEEKGEGERESEHLLRRLRICLVSARLCVAIRRTG